MILYDFECSRCGRVFEQLVDRNCKSVPCPCGKSFAGKIMSFRGYIKVGETTDPQLIRKAIPKELTKDWEKDREYAEVRRKEVKLPDGRKVERIVPKIDAVTRKTELSHNLKLDIKRRVEERRNKQTAKVKG